MKNTANIRTTLVANTIVQDRVDRANVQRAKRNKAPISKSQAVEIAVKVMTQKALVEA